MGAPGDEQGRLGLRGVCLQPRCLGAAIQMLQRRIECPWPDCAPSHSCSACPPELVRNDVFLSEAVREPALRLSEEGVPAAEAALRGPAFPCQRRLPVLQVKDPGHPVEATQSKCIHPLAPQHCFLPSLPSGIPKNAQCTLQQGCQAPADIFSPQQHLFTQT